MKEDRGADALARLVAEAKADAPPMPDWDSVESSLLARAATEAKAAPRLEPERSLWPLAAAAAVALAAGGLALGKKGPPEAVAPESTQVVSVPPEAPRFVDGRELALGTIVAAASGTVRVEHKGHVTWTLDPGSAAHIESTGDVVGVALDRGALTAHVTKSPRPESFVVRVERTRVAVHGTAFRVARVDGGVRVEVSEGVVAVGPVGGQSFELEAPASATLDLQGQRAGAAAPPAPRAPHALRERSKELEPAPAAEASGAAPVAPVERVVETVQRCLAAHTVSRGDLRVTVGTSMSLKVTPEGRVGELLFAPPLAPVVRRCVDGEVNAMQFAESARGLSLEQRLELGR